MRRDFYRHPPIDIINQGFRPVSGNVADFCCIFHQSSYHFFYIERRLHEGTPFYPGNEIYFGHAATQDFFTWEVFEPAMLIIPDTWEGSHLWAPNIIKWKNGYLMAYTGVNKFISQNIGLAYSDDLFHWQRFTSNPISPCTNRSWSYWTKDDVSSCRDPHLIVINQRIYMAYTANTANGYSCIALTSSADLVTWEDHGPILIGPGAGYEPRLNGNHPQSALESANLFQYGSTWYLQFMFRNESSSTANWIISSDTFLNFNFADRRAFWLGAHTMEIVRVKGSLHLLACAGPIRFGFCDFSDPNPTPYFIESRDELAKWQV
jgi:hypothetical protein